LFLYGNCGAAKQIMPFPATYCGGSGERFHCAAHRGEACRGVGDSGKVKCYHEVPTGPNRKVIAATIAAAHCAAIQCVSRRGGCCGYGMCKLTVQGNAPLPQQSP
jgi:hypothetical protein